MSEQTLKILKMLEEGKITADEASDLLSKVEALEEEATKPDTEPGAPSRPRGPGHFRIPDPGQIHIPPVQIPDVGRIVNDALREAFGEGFPPGHHTHGPQGGHKGHVDHSGARFAGARLEHTDLTEAKLDGSTRLEGADLRFASFVDADLRGADLRGANLSYSDFCDAKFRDANLQGARLHHGTYTDADFRGSNLKGADLSLSDLTGASFKKVNQPGLTLRGMKLVGVKYEASGGPGTHTDVGEDLDEGYDDVSWDEPKAPTSEDIGAAPSEQDDVSGEPGEGHEQGDAWA